MLLRRYDRKGIDQKEEVKQLREQGLEQVDTGERRDETDVTVTTPEEVEEDADMPKYSKAAERGVQVESQTEDYTNFSEAELKKVKNDELKAYLDSKKIEYPSDAIKEDYINAILGK